jgi:hypothetical protein
MLANKTKEKRMRRFIAVVIALLFVSSFAYATGYQKEGAYEGAITDINIQGNSTFDGNTVTIIANGHKDGVTTNVSGESNLNSAALAYGTILLQAGSAKSIALADGVKGQMVTISMSVYDAKTVTITDDQVSSDVFPMTKTGWDDIAFDSVLDTVTLLYLDTTTGWVIVGSNAVTVT